MRSFAAQVGQRQVEESKTACQQKIGSSALSRHTFIVGRLYGAFFVCGSIALEMGEDTAY